MQNIVLNNRKELALSGVKKVRTAEPHQVVAQLDETLIVISGQNLSVQALSIQNETLELTGQVDSIRYSKSHSKKFSLRNMFK